MGFREVSTSLTQEYLWDAKLDMFMTKLLLNELKRN